MSAATFRFTGAIAALGPALPRLLERSTSHDRVIRERTAAIIARVRRAGDDALHALACELDGVALDALEVDPRRARRALRALDPAVRGPLERAARNIAAWHRAQLPAPLELETEPGVLVGRRAQPLDSVGIYAPGGSAAYPSSVLMGAVPARVAGVRTVVLCSPPRRDGLPAPIVLAAAAIAGVDRIFALGGAGAIAALAHGTRSVPRVSRIVGPGNAYVAEAKIQVGGVVATDAPAGPSELLVIADETADPAAVARELVAQAEHDPRAAVVAVVVGRCPVRPIADAVARQAAATPRRGVVRRALAARGALLSCPTLGEALAFAARYAPEHLLLAVRRPGRALPGVRNAGTVFLGLASSVAFGDYMTGANHVLPTAQAARAWSGVSTLDFMRWTSHQRVTRAAAARLAGDVAALADAEGLPAHAAAARAWEERP